MKVVIGTLRFDGDVAVKGQRIAYVGPHAPGRGRTEIDAHGKAIAPGFINMLSHSEDSLIADPRGMSELRQGVTLEVMGEGHSIGPLNAEMRSPYDYWQFWRNTEDADVGRFMRLFTDIPLDEKCPQCQRTMVLRHGRYGEFVSCSGYPECKYVKQNFIGVKCPECKEGDLVEKKARRRGNLFYGCSRYPKCKFTSAHKPIAEKCPQCGSEYLVEKRLKSGDVIACPNSECDYERPAPAPSPVPAEVA